MNKFCSKCNQHKPLTEFSRRRRSPDGVQVWCKDCRREYMREYVRKYRDKESHKKSQSRYRQRNHNKILAHSIVRNAIKAGKIIVPLWCQRCNCVSDLEAHHDDYSKPLDIIWLCTTCHGLAHRNCKDMSDA